MKPQSDIPPLPPTKIVTDVYADFFKFLSNCALDFIKDAYPRGEEIFQGSIVEYIISHPNGWAGAEQQKLRQAAVQAKLIDHIQSEHVHFVTEGEASLHFCLAIPAIPAITVEFLDFIYYRYPLNCCLGWKKYPYCRRWWGYH